MLTIKMGQFNGLQKIQLSKGYDDRGITERIFTQLKTDLPLVEMCEEYKDEDGVGIGEDIKESIQYALDELGLC